MSTMEAATEQGVDDGVATSESAKSIKAIDKTTVHRICSGQVVLTLATAVKELVENSLDAGATSVEVRLKDHGATHIEVSDNGSGVEENDFEGLTLKHHTSKLRDFEGLEGVSTFGFRGEALSSLCALSQVSVSTRHTNAPVATTLTFAHSGAITQRTHTARQVGTTVSVSGLFSTLPVRHKEFHRNIKKEFNKMVHVLYSYCLISTGVRITCTNQTEKGKKTTIVSTSGHPTIKDNISAIFGAKQASSLLEFRQVAASDDTLKEFGLNLNSANVSQDLVLEGWISSCAHGQGRPSPDRQFFFVNSRPCDPPKVSKVVGEIYRQYNRHQSPCVVLNLHMGRALVDVNLTPDKRQVLLAPERLILATLKTSLVRLYETIPSTFSVNSPLSSLPAHRSTTNTSPSSPTTPKLSALTQRFGRSSVGSLGLNTSPLAMRQSTSEANRGSDNKQPNLMSFLKRSESEPTKLPDSSSSTLDSSIDGPITHPNQSQKTPDDRDCTISDLVLSESITNGDIRSEETTDTMLETNGNIICEMNEGDIKMSELDPKNCLSNGTNDFKSEKPVNGDSESHINTANGSDGCGSLDNTSTCTSSNGTTANNGSQEGNEKMEVVDEAGSQSTPMHDAPVASNGSLLEDGDYSGSQSTPKQDSPMASSSSLLNNFSSNGTNGTTSGAKNLLSRFAASSTASPSCKRAHSATNDFLTNLANKRSKTNSFRGSSQAGSVSSVSKTESLQSIPDNDLELIFASGDPEFSQELEADGDENICDEDFESSICKTEKVIVCEDYDASQVNERRKCRQVEFDTETLKAKLAQRKERREKGAGELRRRFRAKISPTDNSAAEDELSREITKAMFAQMEVLGQFNLGFILARLGTDLFIVDQHATDEKYNFETLQRTCTLNAQRSVVPQRLELTAANEAILLENMPIFRKNGFIFQVDEERPAGRRMSIVSKPFSRGWEFGREDVEELIFMLSDAPGVDCRPSRVRDMFASRACRSSVMIGTALSTKQMYRLLGHMGEMDHPWNCPHGRPTMRHLLCLDMLAATPSS